MGIVFAEIELADPRRPELRPVRVSAMADSGANWTVLPESVCLQLGLEIDGHKHAELADGSHVQIKYVGPIRIGFENRVSYSGALVMGDTVLLGAIAMQDMDVLIDPLGHKLILPPSRPNFAFGFTGGAWPSR